MCLLILKIKIKKAKLGGKNYCAFGNFVGTVSGVTKNRAKDEYE